MSNTISAMRSEELFENVVLKRLSKGLEHIVSCVEVTEFSNFGLANQLIWKFCVRNQMI